MLSNENLTLSSRRFGNLSNAILCYYLFCYGNNRYYFISQNQCEKQKMEMEIVDESLDIIPNKIGYPLDLVRDLQTNKNGLSMKDIFNLVL